LPEQLKERKAVQSSKLGESTSDEHTKSEDETDEQKCCVGYAVVTTLINKSTFMLVQQ